jgi:hypothetical protein
MSESPTELLTVPQYQPSEYEHYVMEKRKRNAEILIELGLSNIAPETATLQTEPTVASTPTEVRSSPGENIGGLASFRRLWLC